MKDVSPKNLKILFALRDAEVFHYKHILLTLARRGHRIRIVYDKRWSNEQELEKLRDVLKEFSGIEYVAAKNRTGISRDILFHVRELLSFRRYVVAHGQSSYYRDRWFGYLPKMVQRIFVRPSMERLLSLRATGFFLKSIESIIPPVQSVMADIRDFNPDVLFASPVTLRFSSSEVEYLKAAKRMRIPSVVSVLTWDNLTTKGLMHIFPDRLFVWNEAQASEAVDYQFFPQERICITGSTFFDDWIFHCSPSTTREEFCAAHGLRLQDPIITYLGSSSHMASDETWIIAQLRNAFDTSGDPHMAHMQIIVRPHPANYHIYEQINLRDVVIIPLQGELRDTPVTLQLFYDTLHHSEAAIEGANTTAIIETIIAKKPAIAYVSEEYKKTQMDTKHFNQLVSENALYLASTAQEVVRIVGDVMGGNDTRIREREHFVKKYIRPLGDDRVVAAVIADEIESMAVKKWLRA